MGHLKKYWYWHLLFWITVYINLIFLRFIPEWIAGNFPERVDNWYRFYAIPVVLFDAFSVYTMHFVLKPLVIQKRWWWTLLFFIVITTLHVVLKPAFIRWISYHEFDLFNNYIGRIFPFIYYLAFFYAFYFLLENIRIIQKNQALEKANFNTELELLHHQLQPQFLSQSLQHIHAYIIDQAPQAGNMLLQLRNLLRYSHSHMMAPYVALQEEIDYLEDYIALEKIRLNEVDVLLNVQVPDPNLAIAPMVLVTFVENAFKHGLSEVTHNPFLHIDLAVRDKQLFFVVENAKPIQGSMQAGNGTGLKNVKQRLELLYSNQYELVIREQEKTFTISLKMKLMTMPFAPEIISPLSPDVQDHHNLKLS